LKILFLSPRIPYPPNKGDKIRSFYEIKHLSANHDIHLGSLLERRSDERHLKVLGRYCKSVHAVYSNGKVRMLSNFAWRRPLSVAHFYDPSLQGYVDGLLARGGIDRVFCFCSSMAEYLFRSPHWDESRRKGARSIMDFVDVDSDKWRQYASYASPPLKWIYRLERKWLEDYEIGIHGTFDRCVFVSPRELDTFRRSCPAWRSIEVVPNGVDTEYFKPKPAPPRNPRPVLVFTGVMDYFANEDGVIWFCKRILGRIREHRPDVEFHIVGSRPTRRVRRLSNLPGVEVTGFVQDIRPYYHRADVCVIPLRIARGLQNKVLEAMATGNAVVATSNAKNGIVCREGADILIADDEEGFARKVIHLLEDDGARLEMARSAVENVNRHYSWDVNLKKLDDLLS